MIPATLEHDILETLRERDLEVIELRLQLRRRGHPASRETVYRSLVQLEANGLVKLDAKFRRRTWSAA